ncbi:MAG: F0F1 ATP synthase subunit epsilon [Myxococcaceae bacterium]
MARLNVEIVTPEKRVVQVQADEAIVPGAEGLFGVRPGHTPFLSLVEPGPLTIKDGANQQTFFIAGGFAEVASDKITVLADHAEAIAAIDVEDARRRLEEAQERMKGLSAEDARYQIESATVKRETARMALARRA